MKKIDNILVTGGAGYIGSHIVEKLVKTNVNVFILDNLVTGYKKLINKKAFFIKGSIKDAYKVRKIIIKNKIDTIIHLAAHLNVNEAEKNKKKYNDNNVKGTYEIVKACKNSKVRNIIFSSSCSVYGSVTGSVNEKKRPQPKGYYAYTKYKGEQIIKKYAKKYNYNYAILRYFNVCGASHSGKIGIINKKNNSLFKILAKESLKKKPVINIYGNKHKTRDGTCIRDFIHVSDLALIHVKTLETLNKKKKSFLINCGYGKGTSVLEIANLFKTHINKLTKINFLKARKGEIPISYSNIDRMRKIFKWKAKYNNIHLILKNVLKWEKKLILKNTKI